MRTRVVTALLLLPIATDRSRPYLHRALINHWALTHWVDRSYVLFSRSPKAGKPVTNLVVKMEP